MGSKKHSSDAKTPPIPPPMLPPIPPPMLPPMPPPMPPPMTPPQPSSTIDSILADYERAYDLFVQGTYIEALELIRESFSRHGNIKSFVILHRLQGIIAFELAIKTDKHYVKLLYFNMAIDSARHATALCPNSLDLAHFHVSSLLRLSELNKDPKGYEKALEECERGLSLENPDDPFECELRNEDIRQDLENLTKRCRVLINLHKAGVDIGTVKKNVDETSMARERETVEQKQEENEPSARLTRECQRRVEMRKKEFLKTAIERLGAFWTSMSIRSKREFMKVSVEKLKGYFERLYGSEGREVLEGVLDFAKENKKWKLWKCGACTKEFHRLAVYKKHFKTEHAMHLDSNLKKTIPQRVDEGWAQMLKSGNWKPVDTVSALEMIKNRLQGKKESFVYENGWSKDWPLAKDEDRENVLKEIHVILMLFLQRNVLPESLRSWVMLYSIANLRTLVPQEFVFECGLEETPQCICFLELAQLEEILKYLQHVVVISCADEVSKVDSARDYFQIKERINFNNDFSMLLLDKRLLKGKIEGFDDGGDVISLAVDDHCAGVFPQGDEIILWLCEGPITKEEFEHHKPTREDNFDFWLGVLRKHDSESDHYEVTCSKKSELIAYHRALRKAKQLCSEESERRKQSSDYESKTYASVLGKKVEELVRTDGENISDTTRDLLTVVRDVVEGAETPSFGECKSEDYSTWLTAILSEIESTDDEFVEATIEKLQREVVNKSPALDAMILLSEDVKNKLEINLMKLSTFDHRSIILPLLKSYLREKLEEMDATEAKARSDAAEAALLAEIELEEEKKKSKLQKEKKKDHRKTEDNKATSFANESIQLCQEEAEPEEEEEEDDDFRLKVEHEVWETKMEEQLEYPRMITPPNTPAGEWHIVKKKSKLPKDKRKDHRRTKHTEKTSSSKSIPLYQDAAEHEPFATYMSGPSNKSENTTEVKQEEEDYRLKVEHEEKKEMLEEQQEYPRETENEFKEMDISEKDKMDRSIPEDAYHGKEASISSDIDTLQKGINVVEHKEKTKSELESDAKARSDAAHAALLARLFLKREGKKKLLPEASTSESIPLYQDVAEPQPSDVYESGPSNNSENASELMKQEEEDLRLNVEHEEERKMEEKQDCSRETKNVLTEMDISEEDKVDHRLNVEHEEERKMEDQQDCSRETKNVLTEMDISEEDKVDKDVTEDASHDNEASTLFDNSTSQKEINAEDFSTTSNKIDISSLLGATPREDVVEDNSALDMIVKSLWHLRYFLEELMSKPVSAHVHVGDPCIACALEELLSTYSRKQGDSEEIYDFLLNTLRSCLSNMQAQANDAAELLISIFGIVPGCIVDKIFGLKETERMVCYCCRREPRFWEMTFYSLFISANSLREMKSVIGDIPFGKLLKVILMSYQRACDPETGGCGKQNYVRFTLSRVPFVFTLALEWGINETPEEISATVMALGKEIEIGVLYEVTPNVKYKLVSMVGRAEKEYTCMVFEDYRWIRHYDSITEVIGEWEDLLAFCTERRVRPEILFYEKRE